MTNQIIVPAKFDVEIRILFDPYNGQTEMQVVNKGSRTVSMLQIAGLVSEHAAGLIKQMVTGELKKNMQEMKAIEVDGNA